jgi:hypothetical protein
MYLHAGLGIYGSVIAVLDGPGGLCIIMDSTHKIIAAINYERNRQRVIAEMTLRDWTEIGGET